MPDYRRQVDAHHRAACRRRRRPTLLEQSRTRPVLVTEAVNVDPQGEPVDVSIACYAAGRMQIVVES